MTLSQKNAARALYNSEYGAKSQDITVSYFVPQLWALMARTDAQSLHMARYGGCS